MTGITNSAGVRAFAAISAAYPKGSTLSCTDGKKTIKARNTSGLWLFIIPYAATWTLSCTDGTNTASKAVSITTEGQSVSVELNYKLWLFKSGEGAKVPLLTDKELADVTASVGTDKISFSYTTAGAAGCWTQNRIDVTKYSKLKAELKNTKNYGSGQELRFGLTKTFEFMTGYSLSPVTFVTPSSAQQTIEVNLSGVSGSYQIATIGIAVAEIYNWWLEP